MKNFPRKIISILFISAFLFPLLEKGIHDYRHLNDFHCDSAKHHFHGEQHICSICDFIIPASYVPMEPFSIFDPLFSVFHPGYQIPEFIFSPNYFVALRGPPAVF